MTGVPAAGGGLQREQPLDDALRVRPPVRIVPDEDEVVVHRRSQPLEQGVERAGAAVDVTDGDEAHAASNVKEGRNGSAVRKNHKPRA